MSDGIKDGAAMSFKFWHDYQFHGVNWISFTPIAIDFEKDFVTQTYELELAFMGLHCRFVVAS